MTAPTKAPATETITCRLVRCPYCGAQPGDPCVKDGWPLVMTSGPHLARRKAYRAERAKGDKR